MPDAADVALKERGRASPDLGHVVQLCGSQAPLFALREVVWRFEQHGVHVAVKVGIDSSDAVLLVRKQTTLEPVKMTGDVLLSGLLRAEDGAENPRCARRHPGSAARSGVSVS